MDEPERRTERDTDRTIIVDSDRGSGAGLLIGFLLVLAILALLYFLFAGSFERAVDDVDVNVNIETPEVQVPPITVPDMEVAPPEQNDPAPPPERNEAAR